jgi:tetratricopeptide (TPR) repeat protein
LAFQKNSELMIPIVLSTGYWIVSITRFWYRRKKEPSFPKMRYNLRPYIKTLLQFAVYAGFFLALLLGVLLASVHFSRYKGEVAQSGFYMLLRDYDFKHRRVLQEGLSQYQEVDSLNRELDRLEKKAEGVENWLSILKRRRQIAAFDSRYIQAYRQSARRASLAFPYSEPVAIVSAAALVRDSAINREGEEELRETLPLLTSSRFARASLSFHILLGDFKDPGKAVATLGRESLEPELLSLPAQSAAKIIPNLVIMKILAGDTSGAESMINTVFAQGVQSYRASNEFIRLAAEYFYDFGDMLRSAELFSMLPDEDALIRQADALWLAGYTQNARNIWTMLAASRTGALYNLAVTSQTQAEARTRYELLTGMADVDELYRQYGVIQYSRLMDVQKALEFLEKNTDPSNGAPLRTQATLAADALFDLEKTKRRMEITEPARTVAETWLLLDHYPKVEELYHWGAWCFAFQRNNTEGALLQRAASRQNFTGHWKGIYESLLLINEGDLDAAEKVLSEILLNDEDWIAAANLGRIYEARQSPARAIASYEKAFTIIAKNTLVKGWNEAASRIQVRIAYCYKLMGNINEKRRALEYALELNPDNLNARLELGR